MKIDFPRFFAIFCFVMMVIVVFGLLYIPLDPYIDPEYLNGVLAASSIIFGFWVMLLGGNPAEETLEKSVFLVFCVSLVMLILSVLFLFSSALKWLSPVWTLVWITLSFMLNVYAVGLALYFKKFKKRVELLEVDG